MIAMLKSRVPVLPGALLGAFLSSAVFQAWFIYSENLYPRYVGSVLMDLAVSVCAMAAMIEERRRKKWFTVPLWVPLVALGGPAIVRLVVEIVEPRGTDWFGIGVSSSILVCLTVILVFSLIRKPGGWLDRITASDASPNEGKWRP